MFFSRECVCVEIMSFLFCVINNVAFASETILICFAFSPIRGAFLSLKKHF